MQENYTDMVKTREESINETARFLSMSIKAVDSVFIEDGYALRHPELLAVFTAAALLDFHATRFGELLEFIERHLCTEEPEIPEVPAR
jgi:hypothetical protein